MNQQRCVEIIQRLKGKIAAALDTHFVDNSEIRVAETGKTLTITVEGQKFSVILLRQK